MISAIALDDEPLALEIIREFCSQLDTVNLLKTFTKSSLAADYLAQNVVDLLFLDINMPLISGIDFYKKIGPDTMVIFTTAYSEYAVESYNLNAVDYLLKPFEFERFQRAVDKAKDYHAFLHHNNPNPRQYLFVKIDYSITKILLSDIRYIEGQDNYIKIYLENDKNILVRMSMRVISSQLPDKEFVRVHRSYVVPFCKVSSVRNKTVYLGNIQIPISAPYLDDVMNLFNKTGR